MKWIFLPFALLFFAGCTSTRKAAEGYAPVSETNLANDQDADAERKVLYSADLTLVVENPDSANVSLGRIAERYEGYVNETGTYRSTIRVAAGRLDDALAAIAALGKIQRRNLTGQDVTESYLDYQIRLENAQKARDRYLTLLDRAETVAEVLLVEKELERLNETIDLLQGRMNRIEHLDAFATITIELREKKKPGPLGYVGLGFYHAVKWLFVRN